MWHDRSGEGGVPTSLGLRVPLFDDERSNIVTSVVVVFGMGSVTVRELQTRLYNAERLKAAFFLCCFHFVYLSLRLTDISFPDTQTLCQYGKYK